MGRIHIEVGEHLRRCRKRRGLTLEEAAAKIGRSKSTLSKYEKGEIALDLETLYALAELYRVHVEQLLPRPENAEDEAYPAPAFFAGLKRFYG